MRVRVVREAIKVRIARVRIAVRSIIGIAVRTMAARYRIVEVVRLIGIIVSGAEGIAPVTHAHSPAPTSLFILFIMLMNFINSIFYNFILISLNIIIQRF